MWLRKHGGTWWHYVTDANATHTVCGLHIDHDVLRETKLPLTPQCICRFCFAFPNNRNSAAKKQPPHQTSFAKWGKWQSDAKYHLHMGGGKFKCGVSAPPGTNMFWERFVPNEDSVCKECWQIWRQGVQRKLPQDDVNAQKAPVPPNPAGKMVYRSGETDIERYDREVREAQVRKDAILLTFSQPSNSLARFS